MKKYTYRLPILIRVFGFIVIAAAFLLSFYLYSSTGDSEILFILIPSLLIISICIGSFFVISQSISVSNNQVNLRYFPIFSKNIPFDEIEGVRIIEEFSPLKDSGGIGLRRSVGKIALANVSGNAIEITTQNNSYIYSFEEKDDGATEIANLIFQYMDRNK